MAWNKNWFKGESQRDTSSVWEPTEPRFEMKKKNIKNQDLRAYKPERKLQGNFVNSKFLTKDSGEY